MGIVNDLFIMGRMALTAINRNNLFMVFLNCLGMTFQALNTLVDRRRMVIRYFFMTFRALGIGVTITCINLCYRHR